MAKLQRKELAAEFSDLVQQEIKNHNDQLLASHIAIDEMRSQLHRSKLEIDRRLGACLSDVLAQSSSITAARDSIEESLSRFQRKINEVGATAKTDLNSVHKAMTDRESYFLTVDGFKEFKNKIDEWVAQIQRSFNQQRDIQSLEIRKLREDNQAQIEAASKALDTRLSKEIEERRSMDKTFDSFAVNFESHKREIELTKKRCFIIEKNIENLYTQIDRLKAVK